MEFGLVNLDEPLPSIYMASLRFPFITCLFLILCAQLTAGIVRPDDRIVFIGDSITGQGGHGHNGWVARIGRGLKVANAENEQTLVPLGGSGQTVGSWLNVEKKSRSGSVFLDVKQYDVQVELDQHADILIIMLGMNDALSPRVSDTVKAVEKWKEEYRRLIDLVRARTTPRVIALCTPTPCTEDPLSPKNEVMDQMVVALKSLAAEENCIVLPTRETAWQLLADGRRVRPDFHILGDQVHPNSAGHAMIASGMLKGLGETEAADGLFIEALKIGGAKKLNALSYALSRVAAGTSQDRYRFELDVFHAAGTPEFDLPEGWKVELLESGEGMTRYELTAVLDRLVNSMTLRCGQQTKALEIPAPWLLGTANIGWYGWSSGKYDAERGTLASDDVVRLGEGFADGPAPLELKAGVPVEWATFIGDINYGGYGNPDVIDFAQVTFFQGGEVGYGLRWIYSPTDRPIEIKVSQPGFSGNSYTHLWFNGDLVYAGYTKQARGQAFESSLHQGWNLMSFKSNFQQWQWQLSLGISGLNGDTLEDLRYALHPER
jgi:lysophospholipase L1-like esterase